MKVIVGRIPIETIIDLKSKSIAAGIIFQKSIEQDFNTTKIESN